MSSDQLPSPPELEDAYPLSPMQQGMLFQSLFAPESSAHALQLISDLQEDLNAPSFWLAWKVLINRHTNLRASYHGVDLQEPVQLIHRQVKLPLRKSFKAPTLAEQAQVVLEHAAVRSQLLARAGLLLELAALDEDRILSRLSQMSTPGVSSDGAIQ